MRVRNNDTKIHTLRWNDEQTKLSCEMKLTEYRNFPCTLCLKFNRAGQARAVNAR
ncbi:MAG: hypothetical protein LBE12_08530 [Planctomycetaceae bacterium]|nr:hypothetical protein [Planctomycetaceae bacterium]